MKKIFLGLMTLSPLLLGGVTTEQKYNLNRYMGSTAEAVQLGTLVAQGGGSAVAVDGIQGQQLLVATYDFTLHGGASVAAIGLGSSLPGGAIITRSWIDVITALTSTGGGSVSVGTDAAGSYSNIKSGTAVASWTAGQLEGVSTGSAANMKKLSGDQEVRVLIGNAALTAGKFKVYAEYSVSRP